MRKHGKTDTGSIGKRRKEKADRNTKRNRLTHRERVIRWLYPAHCALCDVLLTAGEKGICTACRQRMQVADIRFENGTAAFLYRGVYRDAVKRFKYSGRAEYAGFFAEAVSRAVRKSGMLQGWRPGVLVPVPVRRSRLRERGYNQAEELAKELGKLLHIPCNTNLVVRVRNTRPQNGLAPEQRKENVRHAFALKKHAGVPESVLLVDDIYTTGSTRHEIERLLRVAGVREIRIVCICLASPREHT